VKNLLKIIEIGKATKYNNSIETEGSRKNMPTQKARNTRSEK